MFIYQYLHNLINLLESNSIPDLGKLALCNFILCSVLLLNFINILIFFSILIGLNSNNKVVIRMQQNKILGKIIKIYKESRVYFILIEVIFFLSINIFILYQSYRLFSFYM